MGETLAPVWCPFLEVTTQPASSNRLALRRSGVSFAVSFLIYGANGYTGRLVAETAVARGHRPLLAGRSADALGAVARDLGLDHRVLPLETAALRSALSGFSAVLHCAGPFSRTSRPMADACLLARVHYLDVTGEASCPYCGTRYVLDGGPLADAH